MVTMKGDYPVLFDHELGHIESRECINEYQVLLDSGIRCKVFTADLDHKRRWLVSLEPRWMHTDQEGELARTHARKVVREFYKGLKYPIEAYVREGTKRP